MVILDIGNRVNCIFKCHKLCNMQEAFLAEQAGNKARSEWMGKKERHDQTKH